VGTTLVWLALSFVACGDDGVVEPPDAGADAAADSDAATDFVAEPAPPDWTCPEGWAPSGTNACAPWPEGGPGCGDGEARFPGDASCVTPGGACPAGDFAEGVSATGRVIHVRLGEPRGGDGSPDAPLASVTDALITAAAGDVVALAKGSYDGLVSLPAGVHIVGACAAETFLTTDRPHDFEGVVTVEGAGAALSRVTVSGARAGIWVDTHSVTLEDVVIAGATGFGVVAAFGGQVEGARLVVRGTEPRDGRFGVGLYASDGGAIDLEGVALLDNVELGAAATDAGSSLTLSRAWISRTRPDARGRFGRGVTAQGGSMVTLIESVVTDNAEDGILAAMGGVVHAEGVVVRGTTMAVGSGRGIEVLRGSSATLSRVLVEGANELGVAVAHEGTSVEATDLVVRTTQAAPDGTSGTSILVDEGAAATLGRVVLEDNRSTGLLVRGAETRAEVSDLSVLRTQSIQWDGSRGVGIEANGGAIVVGERVELSDNRQSGVIAFDAGTRIELSDVRISDTEEQACAVDLCADFGGGVGAVVVRGAQVELSRFLIERSALAGAQLVDASLSLADGEVRDNPIGINLQETDRTLDDVTEGVRFVDNERNFDSVMIWVPAPGR